MADESPVMELDLAAVEDRETVPFDERFDIPTLEGGVATCRAVVEADVVRVGERFDIHARVTAELAAECHRCLGSFALPLAAEFDLAVFRGEKGRIPSEGEGEDDVISLPETGEGTYDIFPRVREALLLEIPIKLICRDDCKGLCPGCGADLNKGECACGGGKGDARWDVLKKLLNGEDKG